MTLTSKRIIYSLVLLLYIIVLVALPLNYFTVLIIVPFIASGWAIFVLVSFLKNLKAFKADIASDLETSWESDQEFIAKWESEPKDIEWKFHTLIIIGWTIYYILMIITGLIRR